MKNILVALPALALAIMFSSCVKEPASVDNVPSTAATNTSVSDRSPCDVTITATGQVRVCGLATVGTPCVDCLTVPGGGIGQTGTNFFYTVNSPNPVPFTITNLTAAAVDVTVTAALTNVTITINPGACRRFAEYECAIVVSAQ